MIEIGRLMNLNCALLGTGRQAKRLVNAISHNQSQIISLYSRKKEIGKKFLKETKFENAFVSSDLTSITSNSKLDIVVIATPDFLHYEHAKIALEAGKHVYVEKPLATTVKQAQELIKISRELNRCLYVGYHFRHVSALQFINHLFLSEYFGRIYNVNIYWGIEIA
ncbi:MAG: Gfo/Idh/MocA family oxidoreductase, partial [Burkholderiales bacterium]|nr:Gfo/Idh/MocA family oxidoreductase [Burkholderiales bacterium]